MKIVRLTPPFLLIALPFSYPGGSLDISPRLPNLVIFVIALTMLTVKGLGTEPSYS